MSDKEEIVINEVTETTQEKKENPAWLKSIFAYFNNIDKKVLKSIGIGLAAVLLIAVWRFYWLPKRNVDAGKKLAKLFHYYGKDSFDIVLKGKKGKKAIESAPSIASSYWLTEKGREAAIMAATAYHKTKEYKKAIKYYNLSSSKDATLKASIIAGKAGCYSELKDYTKAADLYFEAAEKGGNEFTAQYYTKSAVHYEAKGDFANALKALYALQKDYSKSSSQEISTLEQDIARLLAKKGDTVN